MSIHPRRRFLPAVLLAVTLAMTAGCGDQDESDGTAAPAEVAEQSGQAERAEEAVAEGAVVIDVRTPAEFEAGHVEDALNIDVTSPDFAEEVSALDPQDSYVVYCRTGNRSAAAVAQMRDLGFAQVSDAGAFQDLADAGLPIS